MPPETARSVLLCLGRDLVWQGRGRGHNTGRMACGSSVWEFDRLIGKTGAERRGLVDVERTESGLRWWWEVAVVVNINGGGCGDGGDLVDGGRGRYFRCHSTEGSPRLMYFLDLLFLHPEATRKLSLKVYKGFLAKADTSINL